RHVSRRAPRKEGLFGERVKIPVRERRAGNFFRIALEEAVGGGEGAGFLSEPKREKEEKWKISAISGHRTLTVCRGKAQYV
ncbi:MAG TPA: hypothetical protein VJB38_00395, partial [Bacteroidota bacterium]|nr:hypothetical protein [Bacteroidota bacterium]